MGAPDVITGVVVVGAGPAGLMLAAELGLAGTDVVVLERLAEPTAQSRASTLHARTMEIFDSRGLLGALGSPPCDRMGHFGGVPLDLTLDTPFPGQWKVPQSRTEEILAERAISLGADLRRGHTVTGLTAGPEHVDITATSDGRPVRVRGAYAVACDGADSTVRRLLGAGFPGTDAGRELVRADVSGIEIADRRFQRLERGLAIAARRPDGVTRVMAHEYGAAPGPAGADPDFGTVSDIWKRVTGEDISGGTPLWVNSFGDASRQLSQYRHGRVLFAGDAAHQQMPIGGQALNLGLQDAVNLGWKLASQVRGHAPDGLLDTYHTERHEVGRRVLGNIRAQAALLLGGPEADPVRTVLGELIRIEAARRHLAGMISGLDIRYPAGGGDHPLVGARLPHLPLTTDGGGETSTTALLRSGRGLLVDLNPGTVLVRPDGYVAWADPATGESLATGEARRPVRYQRGWPAVAGAGLEDALGRWFGPQPGRAPWTFP